MLPDSVGSRSVGTLERGEARAWDGQIEHAHGGPVKVRLASRQVVSLDNTETAKHGPGSVGVLLQLGGHLEPQGGSGLTEG